MVYLYGAGGHGKVIADILECCGTANGGVFDADQTKKMWDYPTFNFPGPFNFEKDEVIISIGNNLVRRKIAGELNCRFATAIHPSAIISTRSNIAEGTVVMAGVIVNADTKIGKHCILNTGCSIDHDCVIGDFVHISPQAVLCGGITVGEGTQIGTGAVVIPGITIGGNAIVGAGAVVIKDVPSNCTVVGVPARVIKLQRKGRSY